MAPPLVGATGGFVLDVPFGSSTALPGAGVTTGPVFVFPGGMIVMGGATGGEAPATGSTVGVGGPPGVVLGGMMVASGTVGAPAFPPSTIGSVSSGVWMVMRTMLSSAWLCSVIST